MHEALGLIPNTTKRDQESWRKRERKIKNTIISTIT
jgi:hypothetical protein